MRQLTRFWNRAVMTTRWQHRIEYCCSPRPALTAVLTGSIYSIHHHFAHLLRMDFYPSRLIQTNYALLVLSVPISAFCSVLWKAGLICGAIGNRRWRWLVKSCFVCLCRKLSPVFHQALLSFCRMSADSRLGSEVSGIG